MTDNKNIDWGELKKKVDADLQNDINEELQTIKDLENANLIDGSGIINLKLSSPDINDESAMNFSFDEDFNDEGGFLNDEESKYIQGIAWNKCCNAEDSCANNDQCGCCSAKNVIRCSHIESKPDSEYIYPIDGINELWLCKECNMLLASKILEQLALETFM